MGSALPALCPLSAFLSAAAAFGRVGNKGDDDLGVDDLGEGGLEDVVLVGSLWSEERGRGFCVFWACKCSN